MRLTLIPALAMLALSAFAANPVPVIFDTDMGNDVDDVIALAELHALETRGEARLLAVTITKDNRWAPVFVDLLDTFYGRGDIPVGIVKHGATPDDGHYTRQVADEKNADGSPLYARRLGADSEVPDAVAVLRKALAAQTDNSVVIVQVGFSTNLARLLDTPGDAISPLSGRELAARKVRLVSAMAGDFRSRHFLEYNITNDIAAARKLFADWPSPIVTSGFDIGETIHYDAGRIATDFRYLAHHPLVDAYRAYQPEIVHNTGGTPDEPLWDPTAALYAVRPDAGYFGTSPAGEISVDDKGETTFHASTSGTRRYLTVDDAQRARVREAISALMSEPPQQAVCGR